ncbi:hypothetical protein GF343_02505, partial [Candidatus Woesearchaeota archaeon]|nr:hypothetical protein [Candidatus Woesearchaeota archaeon]
MLNKKQLTGFCIITVLILLAAPVFANVLLPYETAAVSRIVGDDPSEMIQQLETQQSEASIHRYLLKDTGNDAVTDAVIALINESDGFTKRHLDWSPLEKEILQLQQQNPIIIIHGVGDVVNNEIWSYGDSFLRKPFGLGYEPSDTEEWLNKFQSKKPIVIFDSDYAGLYLPNANFKSFVRTLGQDSTFIAPTSIADAQFDLAVLCNLEKYNTLGELYKQARNN